MKLLLLTVVTYIAHGACLAGSGAGATNSAAANVVCTGACASATTAEGANAATGAGVKSCADGYTGAPSASVCTTDTATDATGGLNWTGCTASSCVAPTTVTGRTNTGCIGRKTSQTGCMVTCANGYSSSAGTTGAKTCTADNGASTASFKVLPTCVIPCAVSTSTATGCKTCIAIASRVAGADQCASCNDGSTLATKACAANEKCKAADTCPANFSAKAAAAETACAAAACDRTGADKTTCCEATCTASSGTPATAGVTVTTAAATTVTGLGTLSCKDGFFGTAVATCATAGGAFAYTGCDACGDGTATTGDCTASQWLNTAVCDATNSNGVCEACTFGSPDLANSLASCTACSAAEAAGCTAGTCAAGFHTFASFSGGTAATCAACAAVANSASVTCTKAVVSDPTCSTGFFKTAATATVTGTCTGLDWYDGSATAAPAKPADSNADFLEILLTHNYKTIKTGGSCGVPTTGYPVTGSRPADTFAAGQFFSDWNRCGEPWGTKACIAKETADDATCNAKTAGVACAAVTGDKCVWKYSAASCKAKSDADDTTCNAKTDKTTCTAVADAKCVWGEGNAAKWAAKKGKADSHVPQLTWAGETRKLNVKVNHGGSSAHYIQSVIVYGMTTGTNVYKALFLDQMEAPASAILSPSVNKDYTIPKGIVRVKVVEFCNLHGAWVSNFVATPPVTPTLTFGSKIGSGPSDFYSIFSGDCTPTDTKVCSPLNAAEISKICKGAENMEVTMQGFSADTCAPDVQTGKREVGNIKTNSCIPVIGGGANDYMLLRCNYPDSWKAGVDSAASGFRTFYFRGATDCTGADCCKDDGQRAIGNMKLGGLASGCNNLLNSVVGATSGCALESGCSDNTLCTNAIGCLTNAALSRAQKLGGEIIAATEDGVRDPYATFTTDAGLNSANVVGETAVTGAGNAGTCLAGNTVFGAPNSGDTAGAAAEALLRFGIYGGCVGKGSVEMPATDPIVKASPCLLNCAMDSECTSSLKILLTCGITTINAMPTTAGGFMNPDNMLTSLTTCGGKIAVPTSSVYTSLTSSCGATDLKCIADKLGALGKKLLNIPLGTCARKTRSQSANANLKGTGSGSTYSPPAACCDGQLPTANGCCNQCLNPTGASAATAVKCVDGIQDDQESASTATAVTFIVGAISTIVVTLLA